MIKNTIKRNITFKLYDSYKFELEQEVSNLVKENTKLQKFNTYASNAQCIYYRGNYYFEEVYDETTITVLSQTKNYDQLDLHHTLEPELFKLLKEIEELHNEKKVVKVFLTKALNISETIADLYKLLPTCIHEYLPKLVNSNPPLPESIVHISDFNTLNFRQDNIEKINILKERILNNFLIKGNNK